MRAGETCVQPTACRANESTHNVLCRACVLATCSCLVHFRFAYAAEYITCATGIYFQAGRAKGVGRVVRLVWDADDGGRKEQRSPEPGVGSSDVAAGAQAGAGAGAGAGSGHAGAGAVEVPDWCSTSGSSGSDTDGQSDDGLLAGFGALGMSDGSACSDDDGVSDTDESTADVHVHEGDATSATAQSAATSTCAALLPQANAAPVRVSDSDTGPGLDDTLLVALQATKRAKKEARKERRRMRKRERKARAQLRRQRQAS